MDIQHKENETRGMFYTKDEKGVLGELTYRKSGDVLTIDHTKVRRQREGEGIATRLTKEIVEYARKQKLKIEPLCPFAEVQFERNESYSDVRA